MRNDIDLHLLKGKQPQQAKGKAIVSRLGIEYIPFADIIYCLENTSIIADFYGPG